MAAERRISYEKFAAALPTILDELEHGWDTMLIEKNGVVFRIGRAVETNDPSGPPWSPLPDRGLTLEGLKRSAGALKGVDIERLKADLRIQRQQDSSGRPG